MTQTTFLVINNQCIHTYFSVYHVWSQISVKEHNIEIIQKRQKIDEITPKFLFDYWRNDQTWDLSKNLHNRIFGLKILHTKSA